ncbi:MAG: hypothetical protein IPH97_15580 [Ignavibacteriales bacterium]|nr:hypothetical protein [Ignavibacteriales bacterium]
MDKQKDKTEKNTDKEETKKFPIEFTIMIFALILGSIFILLKLAGVF